MQFLTHMGQHRTHKQEYPKMCMILRLNSINQRTYDQRKLHNGVKLQQRL